MANGAAIDDAFYSKLVLLVESNLEREEFGVAELVRLVGLSRSQIHRKLKALTGQSISQFIRECRLKRAHTLLQDPTGTAAEVAYSVGFSNPTYFSKCFREYYGYPPGSAKQSGIAKARVKERFPSIRGIALLMLISFTVFAYFVSVNIFGIRDLKITTSPKSSVSSSLEKSIAVLPFKDDSQSGDNQYFCDGMMDEILNHLQKIRGLSVKSRAAVERFRKTDRSFRYKARALDVAFILEGSVRRDSNQIRVTAQLIEAASGNLLWAEDFGGAISDTLLILQRNIAKKVAASLGTVISPEAEQSLNQIETTAIKAYDLRIKAVYEQQLFWKTRDINHLKSAHKLLDKALKIDPKYKRAILAKGEVYIGEKKYDSALLYANRLIAADTAFVGGYGLRGECYYFKKNNELAIENYKKAIQLIRGYDEQWMWYHIPLGRAYLADNDILNAFIQFKNALQLGIDHLPQIYFNLSICYLQAGEYSKAEEFLNKCLELKTDCSTIFIYHWLMIIQGRYHDSLQFLRKICNERCERECSKAQFQTNMLVGNYELAQDFFNQWRKYQLVDTYFEYHRYELGYLYQQQGREEEARRLFMEEINRLSNHLNQHWEYTYLSLARIYSLLGNRTEALKYLTIYEEYGFDDGWQDFILIDPFFKNLREEPEFKAIVARAKREKLALRKQLARAETTEILYLNQRK